MRTRVRWSRNVVFADLGVGALQLAARGGDAAGDVVEREVEPYSAHDRDGVLVEARAQRDGGGALGRHVGRIRPIARRGLPEETDRSLLARAAPPDRAVHLEACASAWADEVRLCANRRKRAGRGSHDAGPGGNEHGGPDRRPGHTLREAARLMSERRVGAAVVLDPDGEGPGIITERDVLESVGRRTGPGHRARRRPPDRRPRVREPDVVAGAGGRRDGPRRLPPPHRRRRRRDRRASSPSATSCAAGPTTARPATCPQSASLAS